MGRASSRVARGQELRDEAHDLETLRPYLFSIAYRMLGSASEAEDIVQEAFLRFLAGTPDAVQSPRAFLSTVVTRLCLDHLKSARVVREAYRGPWLPEPVPTADLDPGPAEQVERRDDVTLAFLVLLERLSPDERAAFVLREAFDYQYDDISEVLNKSNAACRKLVQRARQRLTDHRRQNRAASSDLQRLTDRFLTAARDGDLNALTEALSDDITVWVDGGAEIHAARRAVHGRAKVTRFVVGVMRKTYPDARATFENVNGETAILFWDNGRLVSATAVDFVDDKIIALRAVMNPVKLAFLSRRISSPD